MTLVSSVRRFVLIIFVQNSGFAIGYASMGKTAIAEIQFAGKMLLIVCK
jgi:hypothetical protein